MRPSRRRSLQFLPRFVPGRPHPRGMSSSPVQMEPDLNPQEEKQHRKSTSRRSSQTPPPDHQPQECFGLLECLHNNMQVQTQVAQEQLALLQDIRESMNLLISQQDQQNGELWGQLEQHAPRDPASSPHPGS